MLPLLTPLALLALAAGILGRMRGPRAAAPTGAAVAPRSRLLLVAVGAALVLGSGRGSGADEDPALREEHARLARKALKDLLTIWKACEGKRVDEFATQVAWQVVHFEEAHAAARALLGHTRNAAGEWGEGSRHKMGWDENPAAVPALRRQREGLLKPTIAAMGRLLDRLDETAEGEQRLFLLDDLAKLAPLDPRVVADWKETRIGTRWISVEAWRAGQVWDRWVRARAQIVKGLPTGAESPPPARFQDLPGIAWRGTWKIKDVTVWCTGDLNEARYLCQVMTVALEMVGKVLGEPVPAPEGLVVVALADRDERAPFATALELTDAQWQMIGDGVAYIVPGTNMLVTARSQGVKVRTDSALRMLFVLLFEKLYGVRAHSTWAEQAFSVSLTHAVHATRLTVMGGRRPDPLGELEARLEHDLFEEGAAWIAPARDLGNRGLLPTALELAPQRRWEIYVLDLLSCCAHGAYLLRARPDEAPKLFRALGQGKTLTEALDSVFGMTPEAFHQDVVRFLNDGIPDDGEKTLSRRVAGSPPR